MSDVQAGRVLQEDKVGNDGADELARAGAAVHALNKDLVEKAMQQKRTAVEVYRMMLRILAAGRLAEGRRDQRDDIQEPIHEFAWCMPSLPVETDPG